MNRTEALRAMLVDGAIAVARSTKFRGHHSTRYRWNSEIHDVEIFDPVRGGGTWCRSVGFKNVNEFELERLREHTHS